MDAYYSHTNPHEPLSTRATTIWMSQYQLFKGIYNSLEFGQDIDALTTQIQAQTGYGAGMVFTYLTTFDLLQQLPRLQACAETYQHLDLYVLSIIADALIAIDPDLKDTPETWQQIDEALTDYLTPTKPNQKLPSNSAIKQKIRRVLTAMGARSPKPKKKPADSYRTRDDGDTTQVAASFDSAQAAAVDKAVRTVANRDNITRAQAMLNLLMGNTTVNITLNLYQAHDIEDAPVFLANGQILGPDDMIWLDDLNTTTRKLDRLIDKETLGYTATERIKAIVEGRDGVTRYPGGTTPAQYCDKDHMVNHADGGPTHPSNLVSLARRHHNLKTDGTVRYVLNPINGDIVWLFENGTWMITEAEGPLAAKHKRWLRTFTDKTHAIYNNQQWEPKPEPEQPKQDNTPPPF